MSMESTDPFEEIRILKSQRDALAEVVQKMAKTAWVMGCSSQALERTLADLRFHAREALATLEEQP